MATKHPAPRIFREDGVTIAEVIGTITIGAILLGMAMPSLSQMTRVYAVRGAARQIYSDLQSARMAAVMENNRYHVAVTGSTTYKLHDDENGDGAETGETVTARTLDASSGSVSVTATGVVTFAPNGTAATGETFTVAGPGGSSFQIAVSSGGRIRIL